ncbi:polyprotein [Pestalotiopsis fici hypovirus 1]|nr:polyprotein [Pestalotiopsis fici hypovirus 1]
MSAPKNKQRPFCVSGQKPKTLTEYLAENIDFAQCKCQVHISALSSEGKGKWRIGFGNNIGTGSTLQQMLDSMYEEIRCTPVQKTPVSTVRKKVVKSPKRVQVTPVQPVGKIPFFPEYDESADQTTGVFEFQGLHKERESAPKTKNQRFVTWVQRNLEKKKQMRVHTGGKFQFPETKVSLSRFLLALSGSRFMDVVRWRVVTELAASIYECPKSGFQVDHDGEKWSVSHDMYSSGITFSIEGVPYLHCGKSNISSPGSVNTEDGTPLSPTFARKMEVEHKRKLSESTAAKQLSDNQAFINSISTPDEETPLTPELIEERLDVKRKESIASMNPTVLFGIAFSYKKSYGCPSAERYVVNYLRFQRQVRIAKDTTDGAPTGIYFCLDNLLFYHAGDKTQVVQKNFWKAAALLSLRRAQRQGIKIGVRAITTARTSVVVEEANSWQQLFNGFKISARIEKFNIYSRDFAFTRKDDRPGQDGFIQLRQRKLFWTTPQDKRLVLTMKGLGRLFYSKKNDEKWRFVIARSVGMTVDAATIHFSRFLESSETPDVEYEEVVSSVPIQDKRVVEKPVYVEIPTTSPEVQPVEVVPEPRIDTGKADGNHFLRKPGMEGKSNRAVFQSAYPDDWHRRVTPEAFKLIRTDRTLEGLPSPKYGDLLTDPNEPIDLFSIKPQMAKKAKVPKDSLLQMIRRRKPVAAGDADRDQKFVDHERKTQMVRQRHNVIGRVVEDPNPETARDSTKADIETNPGPSEGYITPTEDVITVRSPTPDEYRRTTYSHHRRVASDLVLKTNRLSIAFTNDNSPIEPNKVFVTGPTPATPLLPVKHFVLPRSSSVADIEVNPGPASERGRTRTKAFTWLTYVYLRIYYFLMHYKMMYVETMWPTVSDLDPDNEPDPSSALLVAEYGTKGDQVPIDYFANVANHFGVPVIKRVYNDMSHIDLECLRKGDFVRFFSKQIQMVMASEAGYKKVFAPHIELPLNVGHSYCLDPGKEFVQETRFVDDWSKVTLINYPIALAATLTTSVLSHTWRIGSLRNCVLPRSLDGKTLLRKVKNKGIFDEGWISGSASFDVIPLEVRERCPEIPRGNHQDIFPNYRVIHCHGGAGTVQTAIACGAKVVVHDPTLDRDYHTMPTPDDFKQPSVAPFLGWLIFSGFEVNIHPIMKFSSLIAYFWSIKFSFVRQLLHSLAKLYVIQLYLRKHWVAMLIIYFAIPSVWQRVMYKIKFSSVMIRSCGAWLWNFPLFCLVQNGLYPVMILWILSQIGKLLLYDYANSIEKKTYFVYEPVERDGIVFPFPFGHWSVYDRESNQVFEGCFHDGKPVLGEAFKFRSIEREFKPGHRMFAVPFNVLRARNLIQAENKNIGQLKKYGPDHNCVTYLLRLSWGNSLVGFLLMFSVCVFVFLALSPPDTLKKLLNFLYPGMDINKTPLYRKLGFAAGIEGIPFELEDVTEEPIVPVKQNDTSVEPYLSSPDSLDDLIEELVAIENAIRASDINTLDDSDLEEITQRTFLHEIEKVPEPADSKILVENLPPYVKHTWAKLVDNIHHAISFLKKNRFSEMLINWMISIENKVLDFIFPLLDCLRYVLGLAFDYSKDVFINLFVQVCHLMDHVWGIKASSRVKTVWGLTGLYKTGVLGAKMRIAHAVAMNEFSGRTDFQSDFNELVREADEIARKYKLIRKDKLGGPQRRPIGYSTPLMTKGEADLLGFKEGEYVSDDTYEKRVRSYLEAGAAQGADGVFLADKNPSLIAKSQHRYEPKYPDLTSEDRAICREVATAMFEKYPEVFSDCDVLPHGSVYNYIKKKYSPGSPFINPKGFKSRQAMFDAGYDKVLRERAMQRLKSGQYPNQFYHAFVKSQVVDIKKSLPFSLGGKDKDVRTVVSQDLSTYYLDQGFQLERNKRDAWETYGSGAGMPLNQSMAFAFDKIYSAQKERGGRYIMMDGKAFDSACKPILFEVSALLWDLGFKDHPSGNGKNISSVIRASYEARQNAWIIGITEPEYQSLTVCIPDKDVRKRVESMNEDALIPLASIIDFQQFNTLSEPQKIEYVKNLQPPPGKTVVTWDPKFRPSSSNWMGCYAFGDIKTSKEKYFENQTFIYDKENFQDLFLDVKAVASSNYSLTSNIHPKNRGGSTGGSDTSNVNTVAFKAGVIIAWMRTTGRSAKEFFEYNTLFNTSDDTIWQSGGKFGLNTVEDIEVFRMHAAEVGINLEIETTKNISKVEYLSKFVRPPTAEDSIALRAWRKQKFNIIQQSYKARGLSPPVDYDHLNSPKFIVVQNPSAILLRRSAFRYYQSSPDKWLYTSIERGAGHALNTAFIPDLYEKFALEWCEDVNNLMRKQKINRKYAIKNGQFGTQEIVQVDPRSSQQALSPRQKAFLMWLKGNMYPGYLKVIDIHMNIKRIDPEKHSKFLRKLERGWRGWNEVMKEGVDYLFQVTDCIPDEWSKKFQPSVDMLYAEQPFYTLNMNTERFVYLKLLEKKKEEEITFGEFSSKIQESPYAGACNVYRFWEKIQNEEYRNEVHQLETLKIQGLVYLISALYMLTSAAESVILSFPFLGIIYKLFLWSFIGLNKVYGILNTIYWHSTAESSREIARISPRDPYIVSKQFCVFMIDLVPENFGYCMTLPILLSEMLPPCLDAIGKTWWKGIEIKNVNSVKSNGPNPWDMHADDYIDTVRNNKIKRAYIAAKTSTGKSTMLIAALWRARHRRRVRKIWLIEPRRLLRDETVIPFDIPFQRLERNVTASKSTDIYICTYGHFLNARQRDVDIQDDLVLFDEFHEEQGEMILAIEQIKAPIFLLSATPVQIPSLKGADFLEPNIDRRHPITIHKTPDSQSVVDMFMEAHNRYPHLTDRALVVVPTIKEMDKTVAALNFLKVGEVTKVYAGQKKIPRTGIIVATPYIQTGADIKPPAKILIDSGRDIVIDKGVLVHPYPFTNKSMNQQRIGRVGRLEAGVVFQPESAGTGVKGVLYPSPNLFMHKCVAKHFKVPQLTHCKGAFSSEIPFLSLNENKLNTLQSQKSVTMIHALSLAGIRETDWERYYGFVKSGKYR